MSTARRSLLDLVRNGHQNSSIARGRAAAPGAANAFAMPARPGEIAALRQAVAEALVHYGLGPMNPVCLGVLAAFDEVAARHALTDARPQGIAAE